jgi:hypothetical protein
MKFAERFLNEPDLFPARQSGEPWGPEQVIIRFAGNDYRCTDLSATQAAAMRERFGALCVASADGSRPAADIRVFRAPYADFVADEHEWEFDFALDYSPASVCFAGSHFMGRLDWQPHLRAALWTPEDGRLVSHAIFENVLRTVVAYHLLEQRAVLLHSAAVVDGSGAHVFFGPSGAGKSTISRLGIATGRAVLSDDMNALRVTSEGVVAEKLPFAGDLGQTMATAAGSYPVRDLCRLRKGETASRHPMRPAPAIAALLECAPFVNRNPFRHDELVETLKGLNARLPVQMLTFAPDERVWDLFRH